MIRYIVVLLAALCSLPAAAQTGDISALLNANASPRTLRSLDSTWHRISVTLPASFVPAGGGIMGKVEQLYGSAKQLTYYTQGQTIEIGGRTYLIAYRPEDKAPNFAALMSDTGGNAMQNPQQAMDLLLPPVGPDAPLDLALLDVRNVGLIRSVRPFDLSEAAAERSGASSTTMTLAAILFPVFAQARMKARNVSSLSNLKQIGLGAMMYAQDYDEVLPPLKDLPTAKRALMPYLKNDSLFAYPGTNEAYVPNPGASRRRLAKVASPANLILFYEASPAPDNTRGVVFADGHAKRIPESNWPRIRKQGSVP